MAAVNAKNAEIVELNKVISKFQDMRSELHAEDEKLAKQIQTSTNKLSKSRELYKSIEYAIANFFNRDIDFTNCKITSMESADLEDLSPSVILKLHAMDMKDLRKAYRDNDKKIELLLTQYSARYTTKANKSIYQLMVIALRAELQNILYNLKYEKLDDAINLVKNMTVKNSLIFQLTNLKSLSPE